MFNILGKDHRNRLYATVGVLFSVMSLVILNYTVQLVTEDPVTRRTRADDKITYDTTGSLGGDVEPDSGTTEKTGDSPEPTETVIADTTTKTEEQRKIEPTATPTPTPIQLKTEPSTTLIPTKTTVYEPTPTPVPDKSVIEPTTTPKTNPTKAVLVTTTPTPTPTSIQTQEVTKLQVDDDTSEILIKNEDNNLVVTSVDTEKEITRLSSESTTSTTTSDNTSSDSQSLTDSSTTSTSDFAEQTDTDTGTTSYRDPITETTALAEETDDGIIKQTFTYAQKSISRLVKRESDSKIADSSTEQQSRLSPSNVLQVERSSANEVVEQYEFQIWPLGEKDVAMHRNGITTVTNYPVKLGVKNQSFKLQTPTGDKQVLYYPDSVWAYLVDTRIISDDSHEEPIQLYDEGDSLVYDIKGASRQFILAAFPYNVCIKVKVSPITREIHHEEKCSMVDSIIDAIAIAI